MHVSWRPSNIKRATQERNHLRKFNLGKPQAVPFSPFFLRPPKPFQSPFSCGYFPKWPRAFCKWAVLVRNIVNNNWVRMLPGDDVALKCSLGICPFQGCPIAPEIMVQRRGCQPTKASIHSSHVQISLPHKKLSNLAWLFPQLGIPSAKVERGREMSWQTTPLPLRPVLSKNPIHPHPIHHIFRSREVENKGKLVREVRGSKRKHQQE